MYNTQYTHLYIHIYIHIWYIHIYIYIYKCVCVYSKPLTNWNAHPSFGISQESYIKNWKVVKFPTYYLLEDFICIYNISYIYIYSPLKFPLGCVKNANVLPNSRPLRLHCAFWSFQPHHLTFPSCQLLWGSPLATCHFRDLVTLIGGALPRIRGQLQLMGGFTVYIPVIPINNLKFTSKYGSPRAEPFAAQGERGAHQVLGSLLFTWK